MFVWPFAQALTQPSPRGRGLQETSVNVRLSCKDTRTLGSDSSLLRQNQLAVAGMSLARDS